LGVAIKKAWGPPKSQRGGKKIESEQGKKKSGKKRRTGPTSKKSVRNRREKKEESNKGVPNWRGRQGVTENYWSKQKAWKDLKTLKTG